MTHSTSSPPPLAQGLTAEQLSTFHRNGYLLLPSFLPPPTITTLLSEIDTLLTTFPLATHPLTKFTTGTTPSSPTTTHISSDYFLSSNDQIHYFFEPTAFSPNNNTTLIHPPALSINKIGHYLHALSPPFRTLTLSPRIGAIAHALAFRDPRVLQSMVICKQPRIGAAVPPHQDNTFLYTRPPSAVGWWFALEDCTVENGCLGFVRGSHRRGGGVRERWVRKKAGEGEGLVFESLRGGGGEAVWPRGEGEKEEEAGDGNEDEGGEEEEEYTNEEVSAGTLVLIHGNLRHKSECNRSDKGRMIYTFHVIEGENEYDDRNWLRPPAGGFTRLYQEAEAA